MSRGSISSWQDYGRRSSQTMSQFSGRPVEFMTSDDIECKRGDGWFLSYSKIAAIVIVFIIGVVAAGFLGWYINSLPKKRSYDSEALLEDEIEDIDDLGLTSVSPYVHLLKYHLELIPIIDMNSTSKLKGRAIIKFQINETASLSKLSLSGKNIVVTSYELSLLGQEEDKTRLKRRRLRRSENETVNASHENATQAAFANSTVYSTESNYTALEPVGIKIKAYKINNDKGIHVLYFDSHIEQGVYSLRIDYDTLIDDRAFFLANFSKSNDRWLLGTKLKPFGVRYLFPVFDDMILKSVFSVSVARSEETTALSNMPLRISRGTLDNATVIDTFDDTPLLSPQNLAFVTGHIETINETQIGDSKIRVTFWGDSKRRTQGIYLLDKLDPVVINLIDVFSMPYPLPKLDLVGLPPGIDENMASPGLISIKQSLLYTTHQSSIIMKHDAVKALINLLGQQWLGGLVNIIWPDSWIFEGSLLYFEHDIVEKIDSSLNSSNSFVGDVQASVMQFDGYSISRPLGGNVNHLRLHSFADEHAKGACLIRMLHGAISDTAFRNSYKKFIARWEYGTSDGTEFWSIMNEEANGLPLDVSLEKIMNPWISQSGYPIVVVTRDYDKGSVLIRQEQFTYDKPLDKSDKLWYIPLSYVSGYGNWSSPTITWFPSETEKVLHNISSNESWVLFNVNKTGYYRVHYDDENWMLLKTALQENHEFFPPETRASLIDDIFSLAAVGLTKYETVFDFIKYMQMNERHYAPWRVLMHHAFELNRLLYETSAFTEFQEFMLRFVSPLYDEERSKLEEGSPLTLIAMKMACLFEHTDCLDWFKNIFENAKTHSEIREAYVSIPSYLRETFYCTTARYGTRKEWNYFTEEVTSMDDEEEKKRLLSSFACFQAPWILQTILNEVLHEETFHQDEVEVILNAFSKNPAAAQIASRFVRGNWHEIVQRFLESYSTLKSFVLSMINGLTTEQDLEDLEVFRENNYDSMKGARYAAAIVEANAKFVTSWLKNSLPEIEVILKKDIVDNDSI